MSNIIVPKLKFKDSYERAIEQVEDAFVKMLGPFRSRLDSCKRRDGFNNTVKSKENVLISLYDFDKEELVCITANNIVTDAGDRYYATKGAGEAAYFTVAGMRMGNSGTAVTKSDTDVGSFVGTAKSTGAGYPKTNDGDANNTGAAVDSVSWKCSWTTAENNVQMQEVAIVDNTAAPTKALMHSLFTQFTKAASQAMDVFVNHNMLGV